MDIIIVLLLIVPVVMIILLIAIYSKTSQQQEFIYGLEQRIRELTDQIKNLSLQRPEPVEPKKEQPVAETPPPIKPIFQPEETKKDIPEPFNLQRPKPIYQTPPPPPTPATPIAAFEEPKKPIETLKREPKQDWWQTWLQNNPDLEKFIGENLANKIGIAVLVLGISFFVKYAIDKEWINEIGRVIIGLAAGGLLIAVAHRTRNSYRSFSSVLVGGGLSVFYFTIAYAFHQYHLIPQQAAFGIMILITAFAVGLSILYDRIELAILATLGGFLTPFLVSTGQDNYTALFTYLCILNTGLMVLAWFKKWRAINFIALFFTILIYGGWLGRRLIVGPSLPVQAALLFATIFYFQFLVMNILNNVRKRKTFGAFDFIVVLSINFLYLSAGMLILDEWNGGKYQGLFTASLGAINLALAWYFYSRKQMDRNFIYLLIGLTITFISLAAPVQLKGNYITLFWAAESVVLFWLFQRSRITLIKIFSVLVLALMFVSLVMDWNQVYNSGLTIPVLLNKGFVTNLVVTIALFIYYQMMRREADSYFLQDVTNKAMRNVLLISGFIVLFLSGVLEIANQFNHRFSETNLYILYLELYTYLFANVILLLYKKSADLRITVTIICFLLYIFCLDANYRATFEMLTTGANRAHFWAHWIAAILFGKLLYDLVQYFRQNLTIYKKIEVGFSWLVSVVIVFFVSVEFYHLTLWLNRATEANWDYWENLYSKAGLSIIWGICAFVIMWIGMKHKSSTLRIISLSLILVTLAKLFLYDIRNIPPGGKIAAFILLGVLLLIISFMYQRLKKIIIDDKLEET